jgi:hypothetical protein
MLKKWIWAGGCALGVVTDFCRKQFVLQIIVKGFRQEFGK